MNMIILFPEDFIGENLVKIADLRRVEHLTKIIKVKVGKICKVGVINGLKGTGEVVAINEDNSIEMQVKCEENPMDKLPITLILALPRPQTLKKVIHYSVSFGVKKIIFFGSSKVEKSYWDSPKLQQKYLDYEEILALEQSTDTMEIPIEFRPKFKFFVEDELASLSENGQLLIAHPEANVSELKIDKNKEIFLVLGPEGGFTDYEIELLRKIKSKNVSLGDRILRTEVALAVLLGKITS